MKRWGILLFPLLLAGCGLPPAVTFASLGLSSLSYVTTGKGVSDHAVSALTGRDCAFFRLAQGEMPCRERSPQSVTTFATVSDWPDPEADPSLDAATTAGGAAVPGVPTGAAHRPYVLHAGAPAMVAIATTLRSSTVILEGFTPTTEVYALLQDDGALEIFVHDPFTHGKGANLRRVLTILEYGARPDAFYGLSLNGRFFRVKEIMA